MLNYAGMFQEITLLVFVKQFKTRMNGTLEIPVLFQKLLKSQYTVV